MFLLYKLFSAKIPDFAAYYSRDCHKQRCISFKKDKIFWKLQMLPENKDAVPVNPETASCQFTK